jgi:hypothetical protein
VSGTFIELAPYAPPTGANFVLIYVDAYGNVQSKQGVTKDLLTLTYADIPVQPAGTLAKLSAVRLTAGQAEIANQSTYSNDIIDLRWPEWSSIGNISIPTGSITHNNLGGLQGGQASEYYHLTSGQYTDVSSFSGTYGHTIQYEGTPYPPRKNLNFTGNGVIVTNDDPTDSTIVDISNPSGTSLYTYYVDGRLVVYSNVAESLVASTPIVIKSVTAHLKYTGVSGSTIVDINKNGTTIFTTQANRPTILFSGSAYSSTIPDITSMAAGDVLTLDIDTVAKESECLTVNIEIEGGSGGSGGGLGDVVGPTSSTDGHIAAFDTTSGKLLKDGGKAVSDLSLVGHIHNTVDGSTKLLQANTHETPDTDVATSSIHHTIGSSATQAAAGNHGHIYFQHSQAVFTVEGVLNITGEKPIRIVTPYVGGGAMIEGVYCLVRTAPNAAHLRVDVLKNGTSIFVSGQMPQVDIGAYTTNITTNILGPLAENDDLAIDILQGDTTASDLSVHVRYLWALTGV